MALNFPKAPVADQTTYFDPTNKVNYIYSLAKNSWTGIGVQYADPSLPEAPRDGRLYARKDADWADVMNEFDMSILYDHSIAGTPYPFMTGTNRGGGVEEGPLDTMMYVRRNQTWIQLERNMDIRSLPNLGSNLPFNVEKSGPSIDEAPDDGQNYARMNGAWEVLEIEFDVEEYREVA